MTFDHLLRAAIDDQIQASDMSHWEVSEKCGYSKMWLYRRYREGTDFTGPDVDRVLGVLGVSPSDFLEVLFVVASSPPVPVEDMLQGSRADHDEIALEARRAAATDDPTLDAVELDLIEQRAKVESRYPGALDILQTMIDEGHSCAWAGERIGISRSYVYRLQQKLYPDRGTTKNTGETT